ncbi:MAG: type II secretion system protein N [Gammaproteobacteria bacterium]|nr:type II secretion system protein N [Gammaproteobacteria bacterium]
MPPVRRLIVVGILVFVTGLIVIFPARVAYRWFAPPEVSLSGIHGTIWYGSASDASAAGVYLRDISWRNQPLRLFTGKLSYAIDASPSGGILESDVAISIGGDIHIDDLHGSISLASLEQVTGIRGLRGSANAEFESLTLKDGVPVEAVGSVVVTDLLVPLAALIPIGGFKAEFFTQQDGVVASVEDTEAAIDLAGRLLLSEDRSYEFLGQLAPKPDTPAQLKNQLQFLGSADERGQYELRLEGVL